MKNLIDRINNKTTINLIKGNLVSYQQFINSSNFNKFVTYSCSYPSVFSVQLIDSLYYSYLPGLIPSNYTILFPIIYIKIYGVINISNFSFEINFLFPFEITFFTIIRYTNSLYYNGASTKTLYLMKNYMGANNIICNSSTGNAIFTSAQHYITKTGNNQFYNDYEIMTPNSWMTIYYTESYSGIIGSVNYGWIVYAIGRSTSLPYCKIR